MLIRRDQPYTKKTPSANSSSNRGTSVIELAAAPHLDRAIASLRNRAVGHRSPAIARKLRRVADDMEDLLLPAITKLERAAVES